MMSMFSSVNRWVTLALVALGLVGCLGGGGGGSTDAGGGGVGGAGNEGGSGGGGEGGGGAVQISVEVTDRSGQPLAGATVSAYGVVGTTDSAGTSTLGGISSVPERVVIQVEMDGHFPGSFAKRRMDNGPTLIQVSLTPKTLVGTLDRAEGGEVEGTGLRGVFAPDSFSGEAGEVKVFAAYFSPEQADFGSAFPGGDLAAADTGGESGTLVSFGAMQISAEDSSGNERQLVRDANFCLQIPAAMVETAPDRMPLWVLGGALAVWEEVGFAQRDGDNYCFSLTSMGSVNVDVFFQTGIVTGVVCDEDGAPVSPGTEVTIGQITTLTDADGVYAAAVPSGRSVVVTTSFGTAETYLEAGASTQLDVNCDDPDPNTYPIVFEGMADAHYAVDALWGSRNSIECTMVRTIEVRLQQNGDMSALVDSASVAGDSQGLDSCYLDPNFNVRAVENHGNGSATISNLCSDGLLVQFTETSMTAADCVSSRQVNLQAGPANIVQTLSNFRFVVREGR